MGDYSRNHGVTNISGSVKQSIATVTVARPQDLRSQSDSEEGKQPVKQAQIETEPKINRPRKRNFAATCSSPPPQPTTLAKDAQSLAASRLVPETSVDKENSRNRQNRNLSPEPFPTYIEPPFFLPGVMDATTPIGPQNVRLLSLSQRQFLTNGPSINIYLGQEWICRMPWIMFQAMSTKRDEVDTRDLSILTLRLPAGISKMPFVHILEWMETITTSSGWVHLPSYENLIKDIAVCRAARLLGMTEYARHIFEHYYAGFMNGALDYERFGAVEQMAITEKKVGLIDCDAHIFFSDIANRLGRMVVDEAIADTNSFIDFLNLNPNFKIAISQVVIYIMEQQEKEKEVLGDPAALAQEHAQALLEQHAGYREWRYFKNLDPSIPDWVSDHEGLPQEISMQPILSRHSEPPRPHGVSGYR